MKSAFVGEWKKYIDSIMHGATVIIFIVFYIILCTMFVLFKVIRWTQCQEALRFTHINFKSALAYCKSLKAHQLHSDHDKSGALWRYDLRFQPGSSGNLSRATSLQRAHLHVKQHQPDHNRFLPHNSQATVPSACGTHYCVIQTFL